MTINTGVESRWNSQLSWAVSQWSPGGSLHGTSGQIRINLMSSKVMRIRNSLCLSPYLSTSLPFSLSIYLRRRWRAAWWWSCSWWFPGSTPPWRTSARTSYSLYPGIPALQRLCWHFLLVLPCWCYHSVPYIFWASETFKGVLRIRGIFVRMRIQIRIRGSVPLTNDSGSGFGSCYFRQWNSRWQLKNFFSSKLFAFYFLTLHVHNFSNIKSHKETTK